MESVLTVWFGSRPAEDEAAINRVVREASELIGLELLYINNLYNTRLIQTGLGIIKGPSHPANTLFSPLPSGKRLKSLISRTT